MSVSQLCWRGRRSSIFPVAEEVPKGDEQGCGGEGPEAGSQAKSLRHAAFGKVPGMQQKRRSRSCNQCLNTGSGRENENEAVGSQ